MYCCTRIQYVALAIILSNSGERMHRDRIPPQRMQAACRIVTRGSCCTKRFAEFNGNCESFCSLEQLVPSLCAADEGKSASGTYHPKTEGGYIRYLYRPSGWTHGHNPPQTSCAPRPTGRLGAGSRPWKARDVVSQNLDENNNIQTSTDRCTTSSTVNSSVWYWRVCVLHKVCWGHERICCTVMSKQTLYYLLQMMIPLLLCHQQGEEATKRHTACGTADETYMPPSKCGCFGSAS